MQTVSTSNMQVGALWRGNRRLAHGRQVGVALVLAFVVKGLISTAIIVFALFSATG